MERDFLGTIGSKYGVSEEEVQAAFNKISEENPDMRPFLIWMKLYDEFEAYQIKGKEEKEGRIGKYIRTNFKEVNAKKRIIWTFISGFVIFIMYLWLFYSLIAIINHLPNVSAILIFIETNFSITISQFWVFFAYLIYLLLLILTVLYGFIIILLVIDIPRGIVYLESISQNKKWRDMPFFMNFCTSPFVLIFWLSQRMTLFDALWFLLLLQIFNVFYGALIVDSLRIITGWIGDKEDIFTLPILVSSESQSDKIIERSTQFFQDIYSYNIKESNEWLWKESEEFYGGVFFKKMDEDRLRLYLTSTRASFSRLKKDYTYEMSECAGFILFLLQTKEIFAKFIVDTDEAEYKNEVIEKTLDITMPNTDEFLILKAYRFLTRRKKKKEDYESLMKPKYELPTDHVTLGDVKTLLTRKIIEGTFLDYKTKCPKGLSDLIVAFANTEGGHVVFGIEEKDSVPEKIIGINSAEIDNIIRSFINIMPHLDLQSTLWKLPIPGSSDKWVVVLFIPKHPNKKLHMSRGKTLRRLGNQKKTLQDPDEINKLRKRIEG